MLLSLSCFAYARLYPLTLLAEMRAASASVLVLVCLAVAVRGLWFEVGYNEEHCFQEDFAKDLLVQVRSIYSMRGQSDPLVLCFSMYFSVSNLSRDAS